MVTELDGQSPSYLGQIGTTTPGRLKRGTTGKQRTDSGCWRLVDQQVQQLKGRRAGPVQVFQQDKDYNFILRKF